jgi:hypothetical protein
MKIKETDRGAFLDAAISALGRRGHNVKRLRGKKVRLQVDDKVAAVRTLQAGRAQFGLDSVGDGTFGGIEGTDLVIFVRKRRARVVLRGPDRKGGFEVVAVPTPVVQRAFREAWDWRCRHKPHNGVKSPVFLFLDPEDGKRPDDRPGDHFGRDALWRETVQLAALTLKPESDQTGRSVEPERFRVLLEDGRVYVGRSDDELVKKMRLGSPWTAHFASNEDFMQWIAEGLEKGGRAPIRHDTAEHFLIEIAKAGMVAVTEDGGRLTK